MKSLYKDVQTILFHRKSTLEAREALKTRSPLSGEMFIPQRRIPSSQDLQKLADF